MVEPTKELGYTFLNIIMKTLGVAHTQADLEAVTKLYHARKFYEGNATRLAQLDEAFNHLVDLKPQLAREILDKN